MTSFSFRKLWNATIFYSAKSNSINKSFIKHVGNFINANPLEWKEAFFCRQEKGGLLRFMVENGQTKKQGNRKKNLSKTTFWIANGWKKVHSFVWEKSYVLSKRRLIKLCSRFKAFFAQSGMSLRSPLLFYPYVR